MPWPDHRRARLGRVPQLISKIEDTSGTSFTRNERVGDETADEMALVLSGDTYITRQRTHVGVIPLWNSGLDSPIVYEWDRALPGGADLEPGAVFALEGRTKSSLDVTPIRIDLRVIARETLTVVGCSYEVLKIERSELRGDRAIGLQTVWLHVPSLMPLQMVFAGAEGPVTVAVVALQ